MAGQFSGASGGDEQSLVLSYACWNSAFVLWIATLVHLRSRQNPRRDWGWGRRGTS